MRAAALVAVFAVVLALTNEPAAVVGAWKEADHKHAWVFSATGLLVLSGDKDPILGRWRMMGGRLFLKPDARPEVDCRLRFAADGREMLLTFGGRVRRLVRVE